MPVLLCAAPAQSPPSGALELHVRDLRNERGLVRVCVTAKPQDFPDCSNDPAAYRLSVPAAGAAVIRMRGILPGTYAIALLHDENGNGRMDRFAAVPREGFGFSRDAPIRFAPPAFDQARVPILSGENVQSIRVRYVL